MNAVLSCRFLHDHVPFLSPLYCGHHSQGGGDTVIARVLPDKPGVVVIDQIQGDNGRLSLDPAKNCIGVAALETLKLIGQPTCGVSLTLHKVVVYKGGCL